MTDRKETASALQNMMKSAQAALATGPVLNTQSTHYWQAQDRFLTEFETFSAAWFKRRHDATQAALEASKRMTEDAATDPAAALDVIVQWHKHAMERLTQDAQDCAAMMANCAGALVQNEVEAVEDSVKTTQRAMKQSQSQAV